MNHDVKGLYDNLVADKVFDSADMSYDDFAKNTQDSTWREGLYKNLISDNIFSAEDISIGDFHKRFGSSTASPPPVGPLAPKPLKTFTGGAETVANPITPPVEAQSGTTPFPALFGGMPGTQETAPSDAQGAQGYEPSAPAWLSPTKMIALQKSVSMIPEAKRADFILKLRQREANVGKIDPSTGQKFEPLTFEDRYALKYLSTEAIVAKPATVEGKAQAEAEAALTKAELRAKAAARAKQAWDAKAAEPGQWARWDAEVDAATEELAAATKELESAKAWTAQGSGLRAARVAKSAAQAAKVATGEVKTPDLVAQTQKGVEKEKQLVAEQSKMFLSKEQAVGAEAKQKYGENYEPGLIKDNTQLGLDRIMAQANDPDYINTLIHMGTSGFNGPLIPEQKQQYIKWITEAGLIRKRDELYNAGKDAEAQQVNTNLTAFYKENNINPSKGTFYQQLTGKTADQGVEEQVGAIESAQKKVPEGWDKLSPKGKLAIHYAALERERQQLDAKYGLSQEWALGSRLSSKIADFIQNPDPYQEDARKRYWEIETELNGLAPFIAVPSYSPENDPEKWTTRIVTKAAEALNFSVGATPQDKFAKAQALGNVLLQAGENIPESVQKTLTEMETWKHLFVEDAPATVLQSASMLLPLAGSAALIGMARRVFGVTARLAGRVGSKIAGQSFLTPSAQVFNYARANAATQGLKISGLAKFGINAVEEGAKYALAGALVPKLGDALNFTSGVAGAAGVAFINKLASGLPGMAGKFLSKPMMEKLAPKLQEWQLKLAGVKNMTGKGIGEIAEEFSQTVATMATDDREGEFSKQWDAQFGTGFKTAKFFLLTFLLGVGMGGGALFNKKQIEKQNALYNDLSPENKAIVDPITKQIGGSTISGAVENAPDGTFTDEEKANITPNENSVFAQKKANIEAIANGVANIAQLQTDLTDLTAKAQGTVGDPAAHEQAQQEIIAKAVETSQAKNDLKQTEAQGKEIDKNISQADTEAKAHKIADYDREVEILKTQNENGKEMLNLANKDLEKAQTAPPKEKGRKDNIISAQANVDTLEHSIANNQNRIKEISQLKLETNNAPQVNKKVVPTPGVNGEPILQPGQQATETGQGQGNVGQQGVQPADEGAVSPAYPVAPSGTAGVEGQPVEPVAAQGGSTVPTPETGQVATQTKENVSVEKIAQDLKLPAFEAIKKSTWRTAPDGSTYYVSKNENGTIGIHGDNKGKKVKATLENIGGKWTVKSEPTPNVRYSLAPESTGAPQTSKADQTKVLAFSKSLGKLFGNAQTRFANDSELAKHKARAKADVVGWYDDKAHEIVLNPNLANAETPLHESTHIFLDAVKLKAPSMYARLEAQAKADPMFAEISKQYKDVGDAAEEVIAHKLGAFLKGNLDADYNMKDPAQVAARNKWVQFAKQIWDWIKRQLALTAPESRRKDIYQKLEALKDKITIGEVGKLLAGEIAKGREVVSEQTVAKVAAKKKTDAEKRAELESRLAKKEAELENRIDNMDSEIKKNPIAIKEIKGTHNIAIEKTQKQIDFLEKELAKTDVRYSLAEEKKSPREYIAQSFKTFQDNILGDFFKKQLSSDEFKRMSQGQKETHAQAVQLLKESGIDFDPSSAFYKDNLKPIEDALKVLENAKDGYVDMATNPKAFEKFNRDVREQLLTPDDKGKTVIDNLEAKLQEVYVKVSLQLINPSDKENKLPRHKQERRADEIVIAMGLLAKMQEDVFTGISQMAVGLFDALRPENADVNKAAQARLELPVVKDAGEAYSILTENGIDSDAKKDLIADLAMKGNILFKDSIGEVLYVKLANTATQLGRGLNALNYLKRMGRAGVMQMVDRVKTAINTVNDTDRVNNAAKGFVDKLKDLLNKGIDLIQGNKTILDLLEKLKGLLNAKEANVLPDTDTMEETDAELAGIKSDTDMLAALVAKLSRSVAKDIKQDEPITQDQIDSNWEAMIFQELAKRAEEQFDKSVLNAATPRPIVTAGEKFLDILANHDKARQLLLDAQPELLKKIQDSKKLNPAQKIQATNYIYNYLNDSAMVQAYSERTKMRAIRDTMKDVLAMNAKAIAKLPPDQQKEAIDKLMADFEARLKAQGGDIAPFAADIRAGIENYIIVDANIALDKLFEIAQQRAAVKQDRDSPKWTVKPAVKSVVELMALMQSSGVTSSDEIINTDALYNLLKETVNSLNITPPQLADLWNLSKDWKNTYENESIVNKWLAERKQSQILTSKLLNKITPKTPAGSKEKSLADILYDAAKKKLDARTKGVKVKAIPKTMEELKSDLDELMQALTSKEAADAWKEAAGKLKGKDPDMDAIFNMKPEDLLDGNKSIDKLAKAGAKELGYVTADGKLDLRKIIKDSQRDQGDAVKKVYNRILAMGDSKDPALIELATKVSEQFKAKIQDEQVKEALDYIERQKEKQSYLHKARRTIYGWVRKGESTKKTAGEMEKFMERFNIIASLENSKGLDQTNIDFAKDHFAAEFGGVRMTPEEWKEVEKAIEFVQMLPDGQEKAAALDALNAQLYSKLPGAVWTQLGQIWTNRLLQALRTQYVQLIQNQMNIAKEFIGHAVKIYLNKNIPPSQRARQFVKSWKLFMEATKAGMKSGMEGIRHGYRYSDSISEDAPQEGITGGSILENPQFRRGWATYIVPGEKFLGARFQTAIDRYNASAIQILGHYNMAIDANMQSDARLAEVEYLVSKGMSKAKATETVFLEVESLVDRQLGFGKNISSKEVTDRIKQLGDTMMEKEGRELTIKEKDKILREINSEKIAERVKRLDAIMQEKEGRELTSAEKVDIIKAMRPMSMEQALRKAKAETAELAIKQPGFTRSASRTEARAREMMRQQNLDATIRERSDDVARVASLKSDFGLISAFGKGLGAIVDNVDKFLKERGFDILASRFSKSMKFAGQVFTPFWTTLFRLADRNIDFIPGIGLVNVGFENLFTNKADPEKKQRLADMSQMVYRRQIGGTVALALLTGVQAILSALGDDDDEKKDKCGGMMGITGPRKFKTAGQRDLDPCLPNSVYFGNTRISLDYFGGMGLAMRVMGAVNDMLDEKQFKFNKEQASKAGATDVDGDGEPDITAGDMGLTLLRGLIFSILDATPYKTQRDLVNTMTEPSRGEHDNKWERFAARQGGSIVGRLLPYNKPAQEIIDIIGSFTNTDFASKRSGKTTEEAFLSGLGLTKYFNEVKRDVFGGAVAADYIWSEQKNQDLKNLYKGKGKLIGLPKNYTVEVDGVQRKLTQDELVKYVELYKKNLGSLVRSRYKELDAMPPGDFGKTTTKISDVAREAAQAEMGLDKQSTRSFKGGRVKHHR